MKITDVRVKKIEGQGKIRAVASITIDNVFAVHGIRVVEGDKGLFIAMPSVKEKDGSYRDVVHPINTETRKELQGIILAACSKLPE